MKCDPKNSLILLFCSLAVLNPRVGHTMEYFLHLFLSSVILIDSSTGSPVHTGVAYPGHASRCMVFVACVHLALFLALSLSPGNSLVSSWCDNTIQY